MRHLFQCRQGIPISRWNQTVFLGGLHAFFARSSAACALRRGGGVGIRDDGCRFPRRARRWLWEAPLADPLGARGGRRHARRAGARPSERSMTQPGQPGGTFAQRPPISSPVGGFFNRPGFLGGLFTGFLGAGLLGMLFGHGFLGGLGGFASMLGLMLQIGLIVIIGYLLWTWWQRRSQPALASGPALRDYASGAARPQMGFGGGASASRARASGTDEVGLTPDDFNALEKILGEVQSAYSAEDLARLRRHVTPEMLSYFSEELSA